MKVEVTKKTYYSDAFPKSNARCPAPHRHSIYVEAFFARPSICLLSQNNTFYPRPFRVWWYDANLLRARSNVQFLLASSTLVIPNCNPGWLLVTKVGWRQTWNHRRDKIYGAIAVKFYGSMQDSSFVHIYWVCSQVVHPKLLLGYDLNILPMKGNIENPLNPKGTHFWRMAST